MEITNSFTVDAPIDEAWDLLTDIPEIAPCLPGAKLTDHADGVYSGGIKIKVGPVTAEYKGSAEFVENDPVARKVVINGKGRDTRGAGNAQALITAQMTPVGNQTKVDIHTDLKVSGKVAQFGRGVMQDISTKLIGQFTDCLEAKIAEPATVDGIAAASAAAGATGVAAAATAPTVPPTMPSPPPVPQSTIPGDAPAAPVTAPAATPAVAPAAAHAAPAPVSPAPSSPTATTPTATTPTAAPSTASGSTFNDDDDNVLDLGDIGLGKTLAKQYGAQAVGAGLLLWLLNRLRKRSS